jgi:hypothetical protein
MCPDLATNLQKAEIREMCKPTMGIQSVKSKLWNSAGPQTYAPHIESRTKERRGNVQIKRVLKRCIQMLLNLQWVRS